MVIIDNRNSNSDMLFPLLNRSSQLVCS